MIYILTTRVNLKIIALSEGSQPEENTWIGFPSYRFQKMHTDPERPKAHLCWARETWPKGIMAIGHPGDCDDGFTGLRKLLGQTKQSNKQGFLSGQIPFLVRKYGWQENDQTVDIQHPNPRKDPGEDCTPKPCISLQWKHPQRFTYTTHFVSCGSQEHQKGSDRNN